MATDASPRPNEQPNLPGAPLPKWLSWVAWGAGAIALFALLLGRVTMDAIDADYPRRSEVRMGASEGKPLPLEIAEDAEDDPEIRDALSVLPEMLTLLVERRECRIVVTTLAAIAAHGMEPDMPVSHVAGYFSREDWHLYIAHDASRPGLVALHEFGHFVDAALDDCSASPAFARIFEKAKESGKLGRHEAESAAEAFAHQFSQHFYSDRRRERLAAEHPAASAFFGSLASSGSCPPLED